MKNKLFVLLLTLLTNFAFGQSKTSDTLNNITKHTMGNIETVKRMYELFAAKDNEAIRNIFDKNIRWNQMKGFPGGGQYVGTDQIFDKVFGGFRQNWNNWKATITRYIDSGDGVFVIGFYEGIYKETGKSMKAEFACEYKVAEGKITEFNQYTDTFLIGQAKQWV